MKPWIKWTLGTVVVVVVAAAGAVGAGLYLWERKAARKIQVDVRPLPALSDAGSIERGRHLFHPGAASTATAPTAPAALSSMTARARTSPGPTSPPAASRRATSPRTGTASSAMASSPTARPRWSCPVKTTAG